VAVRKENNMGAPLGNKYAVGNKGGRPRLIELHELEEFGLELVEWTKLKVEEAEINEMEENGKAPKAFWLGQFARERGLYGYNLRDYAKGDREENKVFSQLLEEAKSIQQEYFATYGLGNKFNPVFTKYVLGNISDWRDKQDVDHTSKGEKISINVIGYDPNNSSS
jgi:hypothetical protein